jgi:hypothetical protein
MRFSAFRENVQKQRDGAAIPIGLAVFYCRRWGTRESDQFLIKLRRELYGPFVSNADEYFPELLAHWLAEYGVVNWEKVYQEDEDEFLKYSKKTARQLFLDESYWLELNMRLFKECQNYENYLDEMVKEDTEQIKK